MKNLKHLKQLDELRERLISGTILVNELPLYLAPLLGEAENYRERITVMNALELVLHTKLESQQLEASLSVLDQARAFLESVQAVPSPVSRGNQAKMDE